MDDRTPSPETKSNTCGQSLYLLNKVRVYVLENGLNECLEGETPIESYK